jgi:hypothetical protein
MAATPAEPATASVPVTSATSTEPAAEKGEATAAFTEPADDRTQAMGSPADADRDRTEPLRIPAKAAAVAAAKPADEPTALVTPPSDETEPLKLPSEPTAVIPAQRRPPTIES